jgi:phospholipase C
MAAHRLPRRRVALGGALVIAAAVMATVAGGLSATAAGASTPQAAVLVAPADHPVDAPTSNPIKHVVVIVQENHTFDNLLGKFCAEVASGQIERGGTDSKCDGVTTGTLSNGQTVQLVSAPDFVPTMAHSVAGQATAINGGKMDGFNQIQGCDGASGSGSYYTSCYSQYNPLAGPCSSANGSCITNVAALATTYAISDRLFEMSPSPSWSNHEELATGTEDGFSGLIPSAPKGNAPKPVAIGPGWGCDSGFSVAWGPKSVVVPSCIPTSTGSLGPNWVGYTGQTAPYVPTIFDDLQNHDLTWKIYGGDGEPITSQGFGGDGWAWAICPGIAECLYSSQRQNLVAATNIITDAGNSALPSFSIVIPTVPNSQHNDDLMSQGDNWIGQIMTALMASPDWSSTAVFLTWDDCGCFYDHVNPYTYNATWGLRLPLIIVSPYAKAGYTDSHATTFAGILAYTEHALNIPSLGQADATAYNFSGAFCYQPTVSGCTNVGLAPLKMATTGLTPLNAAQKALQETSGDST